MSKTVLRLVYWIKNQTQDLICKPIWCNADIQVHNRVLRTIREPVRVQTSALVRDLIWDQIQEDGNA